MDRGSKRRKEGRDSEGKDRGELIEGRRATS